jgi:hypothetical protein
MTYTILQRRQRQKQVRGPIAIRETQCGLDHHQVWLKCSSEGFTGGPNYAESLQEGGCGCHSRSNIRLGSMQDGY